MKAFVEGEKYELPLLEDIDKRMYKVRGNHGYIDHVGYSYSKNNDVVYFLPKLFIDETGLVLSKFEKLKLASGEFFEKTKNNAVHEVRSLLVLFYSSLVEYRKRVETNLDQEADAFVLESNLGDSEYTYLDIALSMIKFHKKNSTPILFQYKKTIDSKHKKVDWSRTVRKSQPIITDSNTVIYAQAAVKRKTINQQETLLTLFYSVLYHLQSELNVRLHIDPVYHLYKGSQFKRLCAKAPKILKDIKGNYYSDSLVAIHKLLSLYFKSKGGAKRKRKESEYIITKAYNLVFEDMIDKLFSDPLEKKFKVLKNQLDDKRVDHIFEYDSFLLNGEKKSIFYIGDSKYYKIGNKIEKQSVYKQFTYARNVIQFNVGLLNDGEDVGVLDYRDSFTEGYNITPNFFIEGRVNLSFDFDAHNLKLQKEVPEFSCHFENRLFDRDTLFVHYYTINFLFALKAYSRFTQVRTSSFRNECRPKFRDDMVGYLDERYLFFKKTFNIKDLECFVLQNFKRLSGKMFSYNSVHESRKSLMIALERKSCAQLIKDLDAEGFKRVLLGDD